MISESAQNRLYQLLKVTHGATKEQVKVLHDQAKALQAVGVVADDNITVVQSQLATFDLTLDTIKSLTPAVLDYVVAEKGASASAEDFKQMTNGLAQALQGNFASLTRTGFVMDEATKATIANGTEAERSAALIRVLGSTYADFNVKAKETSEGGMQSLKNSFSDLQKSIGEQFIPILVSAIETIQPFIEKVIEWTSAHPELTRNLILVTLAVTGLVAVIGTLGLLLPPIIAFFGLLSPPVLVVTGIIAGLILTVTNLIKIFNILKEDSALVWDGIVITIKEAGSAIMGVFDKIKNGVMAIIEKVRSLIDAFKELNIVQGAKNVGSKIISSIGNLFRADGGPVSSGNPYIVGERGPELFTPNSNGSIIPNHKLAGAGGITINISGNTLLDGSAGEKLAAQIMRTLKQNLRI
jgi:hypothetical protein